MLHIVREDYGSAAANSVARRLVMPAHRNGGQAQFIERPLPKLTDARLVPLLDLVRSDLAKAWPIKTMAEAAAMSVRTFIRRFREVTGMAPGEWLVEARIDAAKSLLTEGNDPMDDIAHRVGFGSADTMRHHFGKRLQLSPSEYRDRFAKLVS
jgi:AraC family transcriptional activator FtrA